MSRRAVAALLLGSLGAVALACPASAGGTPAPGPRTGVAATATPLLSVRRVPGWIERSAAAANLSAKLPGLLASLGAAGDRGSCLVVTEGDQTVFAHQAHREVIPASNMKLMTATAVLQRLGTSLRLTTRVAASVAPSAGTLHGNLYLIGGGDPLLFTAGWDQAQDPPMPLYTPLATLARQVRNAGIVRIDGSVLGDESYFDTRRGVPSWESYYEAEGDSGPLSALEVDDGYEQGPTYGADPQPAVTAAQIFTGLLTADGVKVTGPAGTADAPAGAVPVAHIESAPLGQVVDEVLRVSDDTGAELLAKLLGKRIDGVGSTSAGVALVHSTLASDGLPVGQLVNLDGSGLSRSDRVTCGLLDDVLRHDGTGSAVFAGLPIAGQTGTLAPRMVGTPAAGRLHAKTGTLDGVSALSGFVMPVASTARTNPELDAPLVFSLIINGPPSYVGVDLGNSIGVALASYPTAPPLRAAEPVGSGGIG